MTKKLSWLVKQDFLFLLGPVLSKSGSAVPYQPNITPIKPFEATEQLTAQYAPVSVLSPSLLICDYILRFVPFYYTVYISVK